MTKSKSKVLATILLAIVIMTNILPAGVSLAANIGDSIGLTSIGTVPYHLRSSSLGGNYIITHLAGYYENGNFYPAYCLNVDRPGVEETEGYDVTLTEILSDQETYNRVWRTVVAGYPYNSPESLGVSDWRYAYQATKMAVYCALGQSDVNSFYATDSTGQQIVDLIHRLVDAGQNGTATYRTPVANINKSGNMVLSGDYYIQNYTVSSNVDINGYNVAIANFPAGTILTNTAGGGQSSFATGETFQVRIPKNTVETQDINGVIRVDVNSKSYAVMVEAICDNTDLIYEMEKHDETLREKNDFISSIYEELAGDVDDNKLLLAMVANQILEGVYFYSGFTAIYALARAGKMLGSAQMIRFIQRDEITHLLLFQNMINSVRKERPDLFNENNINKIYDMFKKAGDLEIKWGKYITQNQIMGFTDDIIEEYIHYLVDQRLVAINLDKIYNAKHPIKWVDDFSKFNDQKSNFFESKVTNYSKGSISFDDF